MTDADTVLITVYCDDQSHAPKVVKVGMFANRVLAENWSWDLVAANDFESQQSGDVVLESRVVLRENEPHSDQLAYGQHLPPDARMRYKLVCSLCDLTVVAKSDRVETFLTTLAAHATVPTDWKPHPAVKDHRPPRVMRVSLSAMAARVGGK